MLESERLWPEEEGKQLIRRLKQSLYSSPVSMETWLDLMNAACVHENMFVRMCEDGLFIRTAV